MGSTDDSAVRPRGAARPAPTGLATWRVTQICILELDVTGCQFLAVPLCLTSNLTSGRRFGRPCFPRGNPIPYTQPTICASSGSEVEVNQLHIYARVRVSVVTTAKVLASWQMPPGSTWLPLAANVCITPGWHAACSRLCHAHCPWSCRVILAVKGYISHTHRILGTQTWVSCRHKEDTAQLSLSFSKVPN